MGVAEGKAKEAKNHLAARGGIGGAAHAARDRAQRDTAGQGGGGAALPRVFRLAVTSLGIRHPLAQRCAQQGRGQGTPCQALQVQGEVPHALPT